MTAALVRTANGAWAHPEDPGEPGYADRRNRWSVTPREAGVLAALARGRVVLEIGTGLGVATRAMASTAYRVLTVDIDPWVQATIAPDLPENVEFFADRANIPALEWSLAFVDGLHEQRAVADDIRFARKRLARPGLIVLHDGRMPHVQFGMEQAKVDLGTAFPMATEAGLILISVSGAR